MIDSSRTPHRPTFEQLLAARLSRREFLAGSGKGAAVLTVATMTGCALSESRSTGSSPVFAELPKGAEERDRAAPGYRSRVLIRWGDPLAADEHAFDPSTLTADSQERRFGYNNDYIGYIALPSINGNRRAILCVNHEFTTGALMFPDVYGADDMSAEQCAIEQAAMGISIMEIREIDDAWEVVLDSKLNRRISMRATMCEVSGPAQGHRRLRTADDPDGTRVLGTMCNCGGGVTPWGTFLSAEENINYVFRGKLSDDHPEAQNHRRFEIPQDNYAWAKFESRFDVTRTPCEPNRFGWVVEVDPSDPMAAPRKRTALGRFMHEGAESVVAPDGRVVVYMGDDARFEYLYKFVTARPWDPDERHNNADLLNEGTLYVARFEDNGRLDWIPLTYGQGPLTDEHGFFSQADVLIDARRAGDLVGATPMDRPEDVQPDARTGRVYVMCTNNSRRELGNSANPRPVNHDGHIIEIIEPDGDFAATVSSWDMLLLCGDPSDPASCTNWHPDTTSNGWFSCPDNAVVDTDGRLWVTTDQGEQWTRTGHADGVWMVETQGDRRGFARHFYRVPVGAEMTGPQFDDDETTLFLAVQHPALDGVHNYRGRNRASTFADPATRWPDFDPNMPPRPSIVTVRHQHKKRIGEA